MTVYIKIDEPSWFAVVIDVRFQLNNSQLNGPARLHVVKLCFEAKTMHEISNGTSDLVFIFPLNCLKLAFDWVVYRFKRCYHLVGFEFFLRIFYDLLSYSLLTPLSLVLFFAFKCLLRENSIKLKPNQITD